MKAKKAKEKAAQTQAETPEKLTGIKVTKPPMSAAGTTAIKIAVSKVKKEMDWSRGTKALFSLNQVGGIDCPGCAWPDPDDDRSSLGEYCENGAKAIAEEATQKKITAGFFANNSVVALSQKSDYELGQLGRISEPMILLPGTQHYRPISWEDAFDLVGRELNSLTSPDEAIFYTSGRTSNEAAFLYQLFVRSYGTNNLPDCSNMCHESSGVALSQTLGIGKGSVKLEDFYQTDLIIVCGQNPGTNHPRMLTALQQAKKNGARIVSINPLIEAGLRAFKNPQKLSGLLGQATELADLFLQVRINEDLALFKAFLLMMYRAELAAPGTVFDHDFIEQNTEGFEALIADLDRADLDSLIEATGLTKDKVEDALQLIFSSEKIIVCWAMGLTQHKNAVAIIQEIVNLLLLKGSIGKPGAGTCPVRGHSNVQGDRTMGIWEKPKPAFLDSLQQHFDFDPPREKGYHVVDAIKAMAEGSAKVFFSMGGNFLSATPDTHYTARGLRNCQLTVQVSTKLNRSHLVTGTTALILPCLARSDQDEQATGTQFVSVENSMGIVHQSIGKLQPVSDQLLSEPAIVAGLAEATLNHRSNIDWQNLVSNYDHIREAIEKVIPGFDNYNQRVRQPGGFYLPNGARDGNFMTEEGKAIFTINSFEKRTIPQGSYLMMTIRSHDQFNTTIYGLDDRYRGIHNERRVVLMHPEDMASAGFEKKQAVNLFSNYGGKERVVRNFLVVPYNIPRQNVATYFPEANPLVPIDNIADKSHTPASKSVVVEIKAAS
ncbi:MAG: FdhF/YdeP family oxidoreductase [Cyclobacteriaceae bacterium]